MDYISSTVISAINTVIEDKTTQV